MMPEPVSQDEVERRERLLAALREVRQLSAGNNRPVSFADIRDRYPEVAGMLFSGRSLRRVDFTGADLRNIDFRGTDLSGCSFRGASISGARFEYAKVARDALKTAADWTTYRDAWSAEIQDDAQRRPQHVFYSRQPGERFSVSPILPELLIVSPGDLAEPYSIAPDQMDQIRSRRLAIAVKCLTNWEMLRVTAPDRPPEDGESRTRTAWPVYSAQDYCRTIRDAPMTFGLSEDGRAALPCDGLLRALSRARSETDLARSTDSDPDLQPQDIGFGQTGQEFVQSIEIDGDVRVVETDGHGRLGLPRSSAGQRALVRPIYILGSGP